MPVYPISFPIPKCLIVDKIPEKSRDFSPLIPGDLTTYIYGPSREDEEKYHKQYRESYFAITHKKAGWDCMRHYEILANGCVPYFRDIDKIPSGTMTNFPTSLI